MKLAAFVCLPLTALLAGCATSPTAIPNTLQMQVNTVPQGANMYYMDGALIGTTPQVLTFPVTAENRAAKALRSKPIRFLWRSGAATTQHLTASWTRDASFYTTTLTIQRPYFSGLAQDEAYAAQLEQQRRYAAEQEQHRRNERSAEATANFLGLVLIGAAAYQAGKNTNTPAYENRPARSGYQTRDSFGNLVNSRDSFQTKDSFGNLVNSRDSFQTRDSFGNLVNSKGCFQTKDSFGNLVKSDGC